MDTCSRLMQSAFSASPGAAPPEMLRQMRSGIFQALAQSWNEYLRSPQFGAAMKQWMDGAISYRKMTNDLFTRARHETQDVAREDIDNVLLAMRHLEKRLLDRMEGLAAMINQASQADPNGKPQTEAAPSSSPASVGQPAVRRKQRKQPPKAKGEG